MSIHARAQASPALLRHALCIEMTQHAGCLNKLAVLKDGPACGVAFLHQDVFLLQDGMSPDLVAVVPLWLHQRVTSAAVLRESTRSTFPSGVIWRGMSEKVRVLPGFIASFGAGAR
jgi:hypothetical protein